MRILEQEPLAKHTTFRIGGPARYFCEASNEAELAEALAFAETKSAPFFILGGGSNVLIADNGLPGLVIKMRLRGKEYSDDGSFARVIAHSGESWDAFVADTVAKGLYGIENLSAIPGTVGASPVQNIGAYGQEVKDVIEWVEVFDADTKAVRRLSNDECGFSYRHSMFKNENNKNLIVLRIAFRLSRDGHPERGYPEVEAYLEAKGIVAPNPARMREAIIAIRKQKLPDVSETGTAGSFFKNPLLQKAHSHIFKHLFYGAPLHAHTETHDKLSAAWLIRNFCGEKQFRCGDAAIYIRQPLVLVNHRRARAQDVFILAQKIKTRVKKETGITLEFEVQTLGDFSQTTI
ncbi:MAG: UDP-N-acetylmuramate dehydrogenase [Parcubacteria group bacterium]|nr:UDP-N-acetylmuramate dehydrogenase [Parcubacteria group bacterium]